MDSLESLITRHRELADQIQALKDCQADVERDLVALCPHQPGSRATVGYLGGQAVPMFVDRVTVTFYQDGTGYWTLIGRKLTKSGFPHMTASRLGTVEMPVAP